MKRSWGALLLALGMALPASAVQLTDDRGVTVTLARAPQRIVSLLPSLTETVCELGACERLVGVDRYSNSPPAVRRLPRVGGAIDPSVEAIVALRPDVVLLSTSTPGAERLEALGLKVLALEPRTSADVRRAIGVTGRMLELPDAQDLWRRIEAGVDAAAQSLPAGARRTRVYFEVDPGPYAAGASSFIGEVLQRLGVQNIVGPELGPFPQISPEFVVRADPDVILIRTREAGGLAHRPGWAALRAVREDRVCRFDDNDADVLVRPGPRLPEAARLLARCIAAKGRK